MINLNREVCCSNNLCLNKVYQDKTVEAHHEKEKTLGNRKVWPLIFTNSQREHHKLKIQVQLRFGGFSCRIARVRGH